MTDFRKTYKQVGFGQQNLLVNQRALVRQRLNDQRRNRRSELFSTNSRGNPQGNPHEPFKKQQAKKDDRDCANRLQTLAKWREERNRRKLLEKLRTKPPFKVGIVHHRWYSPPITKNVTMKNKQKPENLLNNNKIVKKVPQSSTGHQCKPLISFNAISSPIFNKRIAEKRAQTNKNYLQNIFDNSVINFLPEEFHTSTPIQTNITDINKGISPEQQEQEERTAQCMLKQEIERLIGLCNSVEHSKNEELNKGDIYDLIEDCHARFKKLEELETNNN